MRYWVNICLAAFLTLGLAGCASKQAAPAPLASPALKAASPATISSKPPNGKGALDSDEALLADLANEPQPAAAPAINDPLEPLNRVFFQVNDVLYIHVLDPVARGYKWVLPHGPRLAARNFFDNLTTPVRVVSSLLQGKFQRLGRETTRFVLNSTMGIAGLGDAAKDIFDLPAPPKEDLGKAMATWGLGHGAYLVLPVLGPSSLRDGSGLLGGMLLNPTWYVTSSFWESASITSYDWLNRYSFVTGEYADLVSGAVDPYVAVRDVFQQHRAKMLKE